MSYRRRRPAAWWRRACLKGAAVRPAQASGLGNGFLTPNERLARWAAEPCFSPTIPRPAWAGRTAGPSARQAGLDPVARHGHFPPEAVIGPCLSTGRRAGPARPRTTDARRLRRWGGRGGSWSTGAIDPCSSTGLIPAAPAMGVNAHGHCLSPGRDVFPGLPSGEFREDAPNWLLPCPAA